MVLFNGGKPQVIDLASYGGESIEERFPSESRHVPSETRHSDAHLAESELEPLKRREHGRDPAVPHERRAPVDAVLHHGGQRGRAVGREHGLRPCGQLARRRRRRLELVGAEREESRERLR